MNTVVPMEKLQIRTNRDSRLICTKAFLRLAAAGRLFWLIQLVLCGFSPKASAFEYEVSGSLVFEEFDVGNEHPSLNITTSFRMLVKDCTWLVQFRSQESTNGDYNVMSFDGKQIYTYTCTTTNPPLARALVQNAGEVRNAIVPAGALGTIKLSSVLWMAFASRCYLDDLKLKDAFPPIFKPFYESQIENGFTAPASIVRDVREPQLPSLIVFKDGMSTNAIYKVTAYTNLNDLHFPTRCTMEVFYLHTSESAILNRYTIDVTHTLSQLSVTNFYPDLQPHSLITDHRIGSNQLPLLQPISYFSDEWLTIENVKRLSGYSNALKLSQQRTALRREAEVKSGVSKNIVALFLATSTIALILIFRLASKRK